MIFDECTLPKTNIAPARRPSQKEITFANPRDSGATLVSGSVGLRWIPILLLPKHFCDRTLKEWIFHHSFLRGMDVGILSDVSEYTPVN